MASEYFYAFYTVGLNSLRASRWYCRAGLFLAAVAIAAHELVDAACGVDEFLLAGEEGMRRTGDLKFHQRILLAVDFDGLARCDSAARDECLIVRHILETYLAVLFGMNFLFHFC